MQQSTEIEKLSRYEQRLARTFSTTLKQFREIQAERKAREAHQLFEAGMIRNLLLMEKKQFHPSDYGFVLTTAQVDTLSRRRYSASQLPRPQCVCGPTTIPDLPAPPSCS